MPDGPQMICFLIGALLLGSVQSVFAQATSTSGASAQQSTQASPVTGTPKGKDACEGQAPELVESKFPIADVEQYQVLRDLRATTAALIPAEKIKVDSAEKELARLQVEKAAGKPSGTVEDRTRLLRYQSQLVQITAQLTRLQEKPDENAQDIKKTKRI